jgi:flagellar motor switch protein FliM
VANILSQEEIDALLGVVETDTSTPGEAEREEPGRSTNILPYDFRRPNRVSKDQLRFFQSVHEAFARQYGNALSGYLRTMIDIDIVSADQLTYGEYVLSLPVSTALFVFSMKPLEGSGVLEINPGLILNMIERLFGGSGAETTLTRDLTAIETGVVTKLALQGLKGLASAWERVVPIQPAMQELMKNPQMMQLLPNTETVILITCELHMGNTSGMLSICYPYLAMEQIIPNISGRQALLGQKRRVVADGPQWIGQRLADSWLQITAELGVTELTVEEFLRLQPGDVIKLNRKCQEPIDLYVAGEQKGLARPGLKGRNRAVRLETPIGTGEQNHES